MEILFLDLEKLKGLHRLSVPNHHLVTPHRTQKGLSSQSPQATSLSPRICSKDFAMVGTKWWGKLSLHQLTKFVRRFLSALLQTCTDNCSNYRHIMLHEI